MEKKNNMPKMSKPERNMMKAIFGKGLKNMDKVLDKYYLEQAEKVSDEEYERMWGETKEEHVEKMMEFVGWCNTITAWQRENKLIGKDITLRTLVNLAEYVYTFARDDEKNGRTLKERFWTNENEAEEADKKQSKALKILSSLKKRGMFIPTCEKEEKEILGIHTTVIHGAYATEEQIEQAEAALKAISIIPAGDYCETEQDWQITPEGDLYHKEMDYLIEKERLTEMNWIKHMAGKTWVNMNSFIPAYFKTLEEAGYKNLPI